MIPFSPPRIDEKIINEVTDALRSGWITTGPRTKNFEKMIADYCGISNVLAVNSWTTGAELVLYWYGVGPGDEVIVPVYTYCATANIVVHRGAKVVMVDVKSDFSIDLSKIEEAITPKTKAIIPVDVGGYPVDYDGIKNIVERDSIKAKFQANSMQQEMLGRILILSDAAHSFGATYKGLKVGSMADFTVFSFHAVKNLTTAEGGGICINLPKPFNNAEVYKLLNTLSLHGQNKDALAKYGNKGNWEYDVIDAGFKCNMTDILSSIGLIEYQRYEEETLPKRRHIFLRYVEVLREKKWAIIPDFQSENRESSYHLFLLRIKDASRDQRDAIIEKIFHQGVSVNVHYKPLPLLSFYNSLGYKMEDYQSSKRLWENEITLPVYYDLKEEQIDMVLNAVTFAVESVLD